MLSTSAFLDGTLTKRHPHVNRGNGFSKTACTTYKAVSSTIK